MPAMLFPLSRKSIAPMGRSYMERGDRLSKFLCRGGRRRRDMSGAMTAHLDPAA